MKMSYYPEHEYLLISDSPKFKDIIFEIPTSSPLLKLPSKIEIKDTQNKILKKDLSICVDNSKNLHFQAMRSLTQLLKTKLCKDPMNCDGEEDLKTFDDNDIALKININGKTFGTNKGKIMSKTNKKAGSIEMAITYSDLYRLNQQGEIVLNFSEGTIEQSDAGCQIVFQQRFLMRYYLFFLRDFSGEADKMYISFTKIRTSDFEGIGIFISILLVLVLLAAITFAGFIFYKCYVNSKSNQYSSEEDDNNYHSIND
jgi:hypothetical protein